MFLVFTSSHCQPPDPCYPVRILLATRALHPLPLFSHQTLLLFSLISWAGSINTRLKHEAITVKSRQIQCRLSRPIGLFMKYRIV